MLQARTKKYVATLAVVPVVATLGLSAAAPSGAASNRQQTVSNGTFEHGRTGWVVGTPRTKATIAKFGVSGSRGVKLTKTRTGPAILSSRSNVARATKAGQRYTVSAYVRTNQPGLRGRVVLRETANGHSLKNSAKAFRATRAWRKVSFDTTARRGPARSSTSASSRPGCSSARRSSSTTCRCSAGPNSAGTPGHPPTPPPRPRCGQADQRLRLQHAGHPQLLRRLPRQRLQLEHRPDVLGERHGAVRWHPSHLLGCQPGRQGHSVAGPTSPTVAFPGSASSSPTAGPTWPTARATPGSADLSAKLAALDGPVWLAFHHEPEGDGDIKEWTRMQAHLAPIVRAAAPNVAYSIVLTGWNQFYGPSQYSLDSLWPKNTKIDLLGVDTYEKLGVVKDGKEQTKATNWQKDYFGPFGDWAAKKGIAWGVAETGYSDRASDLDPQWVNGPTICSRRTAASRSPTSTPS